MNRWKIWIVVIGIVLCGVGCDQATKHVAKRTLQGKPIQGWFFNTFQLQYAENPGAFLSLGSRLSTTWRFWIFLLIPGIVMAVVGMVALWPSTLRLQERALLACIVSGGTGNLLDRAFQEGYVTDFLHMGIGPLRTGVFNVADVLIMIGAVGLILTNLFSYTRRTKESQ